MMPCRIPSARKPRWRWLTGGLLLLCWGWLSPGGGSGDAVVAWGPLEAFLRATAEDLPTGGPGEPDAARGGPAGREAMGGGRPEIPLRVFVEQRRDFWLNHPAIQALREDPRPSPK